MNNSLTSKYLSEFLYKTKSPRPIKWKVLEITKMIMMKSNSRYMCMVYFPICLWPCVYKITCAFGIAAKVSRVYAVEFFIVNFMREIARNFSINFRDDLAVLQASESNGSQPNPKETNSFVRTLWWTSSKRYPLKRLLLLFCAYQPPACIHYSKASR